MLSFHILMYLSISLDFEFIKSLLFMEISSKVPINFRPNNDKIMILVFFEQKIPKYPQLFKEKDKKHTIVYKIVTIAANIEF